MDPIKIDTTVDNGEIEQVHIAPIGEFVGSDIDGNPVKETLTAEDLQKIADNVNESGEEILADVDHAASRPGVTKDSRSAGWFSRFIVDPVKGLFAKLKLTRYGKELLENREYRYVSPSFITQDGAPVTLASVSLTNKPAFAGHIAPIINAGPDNLGIENMTKEELKDLIKETISELKEAEKAEEIKEETIEETKEETTEVVDTCSDDEVKNEQPKEEVEVKKTETEPEVKNEQAEEVKEEEKKEEEAEVIKIEALNSAPTALASSPKWQSMDRDTFIKWFNAGNR